MFLDFEIRIRPDGRGANRVDVLRSPAGDGTGPFRLEASAAGLIARRARVRGRSAGSRDLRPPSAPISEEREREHAGAELFEALFDDSLRSLYERSLEVVSRQEGQRMRLLLKVDPACVDLAHIQAQPWEYLFDRRRGRFPGLYRQSPLIRVLDEQVRPVPAASESLRVLVMASKPGELDRLDLEQELEHLRRLAREHPAIEVEILPRPSLAELRTALLALDYHVFHYMGHGDFDPETGDGTLALSGTDGALLRVPGRTLAHVLYDCRSLRLAVLNACETARDRDHGGHNPFAGVGTALIQGGVPAVIAMQAPITDRSAIAFADCFYRRLAAGDPLDVAVSEGRQSIYTAEHPHEWGTPVLFTGSADVEVYRPPAAAPPGSQAVPRRRRSVKKALLPAALAILVLVVFGAVAAVHPAPAAEAVLELELDGVAFQLERALDPLTNLPLDELAATDLERVVLPALEGAAGRTLRPLDGRPLSIRLARVPSEPRMTLNQSSFPGGTWVRLRSVGEGRYRLELSTGEDREGEPSEPPSAAPPKATLRVNFDGPVDLKTLYGPVERLEPRGPAGVELTPRTRRLAVDLTLAGAETAALETDAPISGLELFRTVDRSTLASADLRVLSTIRSGVIRFAAGREHRLQEGELVRIGSCAGALRRIVLGRDHLSVSYRGRVSDVRSQVAGSPERNLMPSLLATLFATEPL